MKYFIVLCSKYLKYISFFYSKDKSIYSNYIVYWFSLDISVHLKWHDVIRIGFLAWTSKHRRSNTLNNKNFKLDFELQRDGLIREELNHYDMSWQWKISCFNSNI